MGANQSLPNNEEVTLSYDLENVENYIHNIGSYTLDDDIDDYNNPDKLSNNINELIEKFKIGYSKQRNMLQHYLNVYNLFNNFNDKNQVIIDDLSKKIEEQNMFINNMHSDKFRDIELSNDYKVLVRRKQSTKKILIIIIVIVLLLFISICLLFMKRKLDTDSFLNN